MCIMLVMALWIAISIAFAALTGTAAWITGRRQIARLRDRLRWLEVNTRHHTMHEAKEAQAAMEAAEWADYQPTKERLHQLTAFLNRYFSTEMQSAQRHKPPKHFLDVVQDLLAGKLDAESRGGTAA